MLMAISFSFSSDDLTIQKGHIDTLKYDDGIDLVDSVKYNRKDYGGWKDYDHDCQNTRNEILIRDNFLILNEVTFKTEKKCRVLYGFWFDPFTGTYTSDPKALDIDHTVPLANAHISGAWKWSKAKKKRYANYMINNYHLLAVSASENRKKGAKGPDKYLPPFVPFRGLYCEIWTKIKVYWDLTATKPELDTLHKYLDGIEGVEFPKLR